MVGNLGLSPVARSRSDGPHMNLAETLACFGAVIGLAIFIYLFCRWCQCMEGSALDTQGHRIEQRGDLDEPILGESANNVVVRRQTVVFMPPPSAEAEPQYYSGNRI